MSTRRNITVRSQNFMRVVRILHFQMAVIITGAEFLLLIALYAIFMFSDKVPLSGLVALGFLWVARWRVTGRLTTATPMDVPILGILAMLSVSLYVSADWSLSLPKVYGLILGIAIFYAVVNAISTIRRVKLATAGLILISTAVTALGLVGADWAGTKFFFLPKVYEYIPHLIRGVPRSISGGGIQPNIVGGALTFFIPFLASLLWAGREFKTVRFVKNRRLSGILYAGYWTVLLFSLFLTSFTLILTQSRSSLIGVAVGLLALAAWHDRRFLWIIPLAALSFFVAAQVWGVGNLLEFMSRIATTGGGTLPDRIEIWKRAIYMIMDFPFTGIGIGTFGPVAQALYPFFGTNANAIVPHAHNILLTVAVDLGIPGLVLYVALLSCFAFTASRAYKAVDRSLHVLIVGLACGMLAHQIFGITDAFMLGTKFGAVMWVFFGLVVALYVNREKLARQVLGNMAGNEVGENNGSGRNHKVGGGQARSRFGNFLLAIAYWVLFSLLAIAFVGDRPYLSLVIALAGGGILGFICTKSFESKTQMGV